MPYEPLAPLRHCRILHTDSRRAIGIRSIADSERSRLDVEVVLFPDHQGVKVDENNESLVCSGAGWNDCVGSLSRGADLAFAFALVRIDV